MKRTIIPLVVLALLLVLFMDRLATPRLSGAIDSPLIGQSVPITVKTKPPYIINVFASWCAPCAIEHPHLMTLQKQGIKIIGIAYKDKKENIARYLKIGGNPYTEVLYDDAGDIGITLGITGVPESFSVNAAGILTARQQGPFADEKTTLSFAKDKP